MEEQQRLDSTTNGQTGSWHPPTPITPASPGYLSNSTTLPARPTTPTSRSLLDAFDPADVEYSSPSYVHSPSGSSFHSSPQRTFSSSRNTMRQSAAAMSETQLDFRTLEYVGTVDENLMCPVCHTPLINAIPTICDHVFCSDCFEQAYNISPTCPVDRTRLRPPNHTNSTARIITNQLDALEVKCPNSDAGCEKTLARSMAQNHVDRYCGYSQVKCPEETCEGKVARKDLSKGCLHWLATCPDCKESLFEVEMEQHRARHCRERIATCEKCHASYLRIESDAHSQECPEVIAACKWAQYGCEHQSKRRALQYHAPECHFRFMGPMVDSLKLEVTKLSNEVQVLNERDKAKDRRIRFLESYKNAPSLYSDTTLDLSLPDPTSSSHETAPYDSRDQYLLSLLETQESKVDQLSVGITELEAKQTVMLFNETIPIKEQLAELRSAQSVIACHVRWLMNLRLQERRPGLSGAGATSTGGGSGGGGQKESQAGSSDGGGSGGLQPRRLSDSRENITKL